MTFLRRLLLLLLTSSALVASAYPQDFGLTPLMVAAVTGTPSEVSQLIADGAQLEVQSPRGKTALHLAAEFNSDPAVVRLLLAAGARLAARDFAGRTPLMAAALHNTVPVIEVLLGAGAKPWDRDLKGRTPYQYAVGEVGQPNRRLQGSSVVWMLYNNRSPRSPF